jgi:hypothetical protein
VTFATYRDIWLPRTRHRRVLLPEPLACPRCSEGWVGVSRDEIDQVPAATTLRVCRTADPLTLLRAILSRQPTPAQSMATEHASLTPGSHWHPACSSVNARRDVLPLGRGGPRYLPGLGDLQNIYKTVLLIATILRQSSVFLSEGILSVSSLGRTAGSDARCKLRIKHRIITVVRWGTATRN